MQPEQDLLYILVLLEDDKQQDEEVEDTDTWSDTKHWPQSAQQCLDQTATVSTTVSGSDLHS